MENKSTIYTLFRHFNFEMDTTITILCETILSRFCNESNKYTGTEQFIYPWRENKVPLKDMTPYIGKLNFEYLSKDSLYYIEVQEKRSYLEFRKNVPKECHALIKYCSGYFNHPDIIWNPAKRKQILLLASKLKDPTDPQMSTWEKLITNISKRVQKFTKIDMIVSHSTVKEIVDFLSRICKLVNYEINFIEAKLTNAAERMISTLAFTFAFKSVLNVKFEEQRDDKSDESERKENDLIYFLQKVKNRKSARGGWDRKEMRKGDLTMARRFAGDFLAAVCRGVNTACERSINEEYLEKETHKFSHKNILLIANKRVTEQLCSLSTLRSKNDFTIQKSINENNFVVQFICNRTQTLKNMFQEQWRKLSIELYRKISRNMKIKFKEQIATFKNIFKKILEGLEGMCIAKDRLVEVGTDSDSNFEVATETETEESACDSDPKTREAPFKAMVLFLEKYLNPKVSPDEFNQFFTDVFEVDGVRMIRHHDTYVLFEKPHHPVQVLDEEIFKMLTDTNMFSNTETIFNIKVYIDEFLYRLNCYEYQVTVGEYENILKATKQRLEANIINCPSKCPSCGKSCEKEIHSQEGKCQILTGHQFCSMGGNVWNTNKNRTAILLMCDDYEEDSPVLIPGQNMKWWEFKEKCGDQWDWTLPTEEEYVALQKKNRNQVIEIWNKYGKEILKYYENRGTQITYIPYTSRREIYDSLFDLKYYVCFVIDGTDLMGEKINLIKNWVSDLMKDAAFGGQPYFKIIVYHGHAVSKRKCVEKFPKNSEFTTEAESIQNFIDKITTYGGDGTESAMLHGLAIATTQSDWKSRYGTRNVIFHIYFEPTVKYFNIFTAEGKCGMGCPLRWERDIRDKLDKLKVDYRPKRLVGYTHSEFKHTSSEPVGPKVSSKYTLNYGKKTNPKKDILINYQVDD